MRNSRAKEAKVRVLIADDDDLFAAALEALLALDDRFRLVGRAHNGSRAIALTNTLSPDVILMDIDMPQTDGVQATKRIHASHPRLAIVAVSGSDHYERALEIRQAGATDYVRKSCVPEELIPAIFAAIDKCS